MQNVAQTTSISGQHHVHRIHTFIPLKGPSDSAMQHAIPALIIEARRGDYLVFFMFRHNFNKYRP